MSDTIETADGLYRLPVGCVVADCGDERWVKVGPERWWYTGDAGDGRATPGDVLEWAPLAVAITPDTTSATANLRVGIEALADEWDEQGARLLAGADAYRPGSRTRAALDARAGSARGHAARLRALLSTDDEKGTRA